MRKPLNPEHVDVSKGEVQCPSVTPNEGDGVLCCALKEGHTSQHEDSYGYGHGVWTTHAEWLAGLAGF